MPQEMLAMGCRSSTHLGQPICNASLETKDECLISQHYKSLFMNEQTNKTVCTNMCAGVNLEAPTILWLLLPNRSNVSSFLRSIQFILFCSGCFETFQNCACAFELLTSFEKQTVHQTNERPVNYFLWCDVFHLKGG